MAEHELNENVIANRKYIGPNKTGDNIDADRNASYGFGSDGNWLRVPLPLIDQPYDYVGFSNPDGNGNYQTVVFKTGGSGGATNRTLTMAFDGANNVTSIARA